MTSVNGVRADAHGLAAHAPSEAVPSNRPEALREQARDYLRLAAMTQIPALAQEFRAKAHALFARAVLVEREIGHPAYFALA
jgi:hypothetical protein